MKRRIALLMLFYATSLICSPASSLHTINEESLSKTIGQKLNILDITLSPSIHGGDNKVFFIKKGTSIVGVAKCYTKRTFGEVEKICQFSQLLRKELPIPQITNLFMFNDIPVVLQAYMTGQHYEHLNETQLKNVALCMAKIHSIHSNSIDKAINVKEFDYNQLLERCTSFPEFDSLINLYRSLDLKYLNALSCAIIHGDISASNILFVDDELSGIIDLDHARYSFRLTDIARAQVFFAFDEDGNFDEDKIKQFVASYQKETALLPVELNYFYSHLKLLLIKMVIETYYYVEVIKEVSPEIFKKSSFNQSWQLLLKKLHAIQNRQTLVL